MKNLSIIFVLLLCSLPATCQIGTPGFTHYTTCPATFSQVDSCIGWYQPTGGTSDYFNYCAAGTDVGVPQNFFGYQDAVDSVYTGLYTYGPIGLTDYREYIGTTIAPLIVGHTYTMTISVSLSDNSNYANDGLGVFFSTYRVDTSSLISTFPLAPQIDYSSYGIITDKINWVTLSKTFVADSAYTHLMVGCFKSDVTTSVSHVGGGDPALDYAYYYIHSIGLPDYTGGPIDTIVIPPVDPPVTPPVDTVKHNFPSGFTPNGDGWNDVFRIIGLPGYNFEGYSLSIYNRFGQRVFFTEDQAAGWNGVYNQVSQEVGVYFYMATYNFNGERKIVKGNVTLVR